MPVYATTNNWVKDGTWNWAHLLTIEQHLVCRPTMVVQPQPPRADENDKRCPTCSSLSGTRAL